MINLNIQYVLYYRFLPLSENKEKRKYIEYRYFQYPRKPFQAQMA